MYGSGKPEWSPGVSGGKTRNPKPETVLAAARKLEMANQKAANRAAAFKNQGKVLGVASGETKEEVPASAQPGTPRVTFLEKANLAKGRSILARLAIGDRKALDDAGLDPMTEPDVQSHEWGLGRDKKGLWLVSGAAGEINWSKLPGFFPIAHTHPARNIDTKAVADELGATSFIQALKTWGDRSTAAPADARPLNAMPGDLWYLFPSNADIVSGYVTGDGTTSQTVFTPFRCGPGGSLSTTEGEGIAVAYGPCKAVLDENWAGTATANRTLGADGIEALCIRYYMAKLAFMTAAGALLTEGMLRCSSESTGSSGSYSGAGAWYFTSYQLAKTTFTRKQVMDNIRKALG